MKLNEEVKFLNGIYKKLVNLGGNVAKTQQTFVDIISMPDMKFAVSPEAVEIIFDVHDFKVKAPTKTTTIKQVASVDPCSRGFSGTRNGGC